MWSTNINIINNTNYTISLFNEFIPQQVITPNGGNFSWSSSDSPNTTSLKFWMIEGEVNFQGGLNFGKDCGVWADRGYMEFPSVTMDIDVNGLLVSQILNGGQTIVKDFSSGGNISLSFIE